MASVSALLILMASTQFANGVNGKVQLYDCHTLYANGMWKTMWDAEWKAWCCQNDGIGCPTTSTETTSKTSKTTTTHTTNTVTTGTTTTITVTSTSSVTTTTETTTTTNLGCMNTNCTSEGHTATCLARINSAQQDVTILNRAGNLAGDQYHKFICASAVQLVRSQCSSCHLCSPQAFCADNMAMTCGSTVCSFNGVGDSCHVRLHNALRNHPDVAKSATPCLTAAEVVRADCPVCGACSTDWWCSQQGQWGPKPAPAPAPQHSEGLTQHSEGLMPGSCQAMCTFAGHSGTCEKRMRWALKHNPQIPMSPDGCLAAAKLVKSQCPVCDECSGRSWCAQPAQQGLLQQPQELATPGQCSAMCTVHGQSASCEERMRWAMNNAPQISMSSHACLAAGEFVKSECPVCHQCSTQWWCSQPAQTQLEAQVIMKKFENIDDINADGLFARVGFTKSMSTVPVLIFIAIGIGFALLRQRSAAVNVRVASTIKDQASESFSDPLCTTSDDKDLSEGA